MYVSGVDGELLLSNLLDSTQEERERERERELTVEVACILFSIQSWDELCLLSQQVGPVQAIKEWLVLHNTHS